MSGMSLYTRRTPSTPGVARVYSYVSTECADSAHRPPHRGLPSTTLTALFALDAPLVVSPTEEQWSEAEGPRHLLCLAGLHDRPAYLQRPDRQEGVQLAVHPLASRRLFGLPAGALSELTQEGENVLGPLARQLHSRVGSSHDPAERVRLVDEGLAELARRHEHRAGPRREVISAWTLLERSQGRLPVNALAREIGLTSRHLSTLIQAELGLGPKRLAELFRFESAHAALVAALRDGRMPNLAALAYRHGYSDHSHLVREYRRLTGTTPSGWIAEEFRNVQDGGHQPLRDSAS